MLSFRPSAHRRPALAGLLSGLAAAAGYQGCFVSIAPPAEDLGSQAGTAGLATGGSGEPVGGAGTGGMEQPGSGGAPPVCEPTQKLCDGSCVSLDNPAFGCSRQGCEPCNPNGQAGCAQGACVVSSCAPGFADCDLDAENGCEHSFGEALDLESPLAAQSFEAKPSAAQWAALPLVTIARPCANCAADQPGGRQEPPVVNIGEKPPPLDLSAYFRAAHSPAALYLQVSVVDDELVRGGAPLEQDAVLVLLDGANDRRTFGPDDHHLVIGLDGSFNEPDRQQIPLGVEVVTTELGPACYQIEATLRWAFVAGVADGSAPAPASGSVLGFSVGVSDWDKGERRNLLFWRSPGPQYAYNTSEYAELRLAP
jgi:hypothetical protein